VRIYNTCDTAELILENRTQNVPGFLYNKGRGRTEFRRARFLNLGSGRIAIGDQDTLDFGNALSGSFIRNQFSAGQNANFWINGNARIDSALTLSNFKNNETEDSILTTDINGNVKLKLAGGPDFYTTDGTLSSDRSVYQDSHSLNFNSGTGFFASGEYQGKEYGIGTYERPMQNNGVRVTWGNQEMQLNDGAIRFTASYDYPGNYQFHIFPYGTATGKAAIDAARIGYSSGTWYNSSPVVPLDVYASPNSGFPAAMRIIDGKQAAGKVLTSDASGIATWQTPGSPIITTASGLNLSAEHHTVLVNNSSSVNIALPAASANVGRIYFIKKISASTSSVTVLPTGSDTIDGGANYTLGSANKCVQVQSNGSGWYILTVM
jgi:hypothetical protein